MRRNSKRKNIKNPIFFNLDQRSKVYPVLEMKISLSSNYSFFKSFTLP